MPRMVSLPKRFAELIPELAKFGVVGLVGSIVDLGGAAYLHGAVGRGRFRRVQPRRLRR